MGRQADDEKEEVGQPDGETRRELAEAGGVLALRQQHVVGDDDADRDGESGRPAAVAIGESERQRDQAHHQAGGGDGEHLVHADTGDPALLGRGRNVARELAQLAERELARSAAARDARPLGRQEAVAQHDAQRLVPAGLVAFR